jgi:hypothetical protein
MDRDFVLAVFQSHGEQASALERLLEDAQGWDALLEDERLFQAVIDSPSVALFSPALYFYVLVRRVLNNAGLESRELADYIAIVLIHCLESHELHETAWPRLYWIDLLESLEHVTGRDRFYKILDWANLALFITGVFPDYIEKRVARCGAPSLPFYESVGASCYRMVQGHALADEFNLKSVFSALGDAFSVARQALNVLRDRMIFIKYPMGLDTWGAPSENKPPF